MTIRKFAFDLPRWRPRRQLWTDTLALIAGALIWWLLYGWLAARMLVQRTPVSDSLNLSIIALVLVLGVYIGVGWWIVGERWLSLLRPGGGRALSLKDMLALSPSQFEEYVARRIFERQGFSVLNTPDVKDGGIDILLTDAEGRRAVVQCKRYRGTVGAETVRDLYGTMIHNGATAAFLVTTGAISREAHLWAEVDEKPLVLIDGQELEELAHSVPSAPWRGAGGK